MILLIIIVISALSLLGAWLLARYVMRQGTGTATMQVISDAVKDGAEAFLYRQYSTIGIFTLVLTVLIFSIYALVKGDLNQAWRTTVAFLFGACSSAVAGYVGMSIAIRANIRTASAVATGMAHALKVSFRGGAVSGITIVALSLLGIAVLFSLYGGQSSPEKVPFLIVGYGFGASFVALFAQLGGGIYTKAADIGADLVGKVEEGIPEDDPRNPATIADLVGDNVGDCAGRGADLFESTAAENIGAMILGVALYPYFHLFGILFPLMVRAAGLLASLVGIYSVRMPEDGDPMRALNRGYFITSILAALGMYFATRELLVIGTGAAANHEPGNWLFLAGVIGLMLSIVVIYITQYYTDYRYRPVRSIATSSRTGSATVIITGLSVAFECTALPVIAISAAILASYYCGVRAFAGLEVGSWQAGLYGTAVATMGMLSTCAYVLAMDTFGPITDNAGGIAEMSHQAESLRAKTDRLDAVGNTTKALTKGYAIGSAALAAFLLFSAYLDQIENLTGHPLDTVNIAKPVVFVGGLLGVMLVFLFSGLTLRAVGRAAYYVINEVRDQFRMKPEILKGAAKPNYAQCVDIVTRGALKEMVPPGVLAVAMPILAGLIFKAFGLGAEGEAAFLMVGTIGGILVATFMNNGGGAWDNAKKFIETGELGGKGSEAHKAAVVGDTVGDPLKDAAGPSLHVLIKLLSTLTLILAPLFV